MKRFAVAAVALICLWLSQAAIRVIAVKEVFIAFAGLIIALWYGAFSAHAAGNSQTVIPDGEYYYEVRRGETLSQLAEAWLDSPAEWQTIAAANEIDSPKKLKAETFVRVPMSQNPPLWRNWFHGSRDWHWLPAPRSHIKVDLDGDGVMEQIAFDPGRVQFTYDEEKDQAVEHEMKIVIKGVKEPQQVLGRHLLSRTVINSRVEWALLWALPGNEWLLAVEVYSETGASGGRTSDVVWLRIHDGLKIDKVHEIREAFSRGKSGWDFHSHKTFSLVPLKREGSLFFEITEKTSITESSLDSKNEITTRTSKFEVTYYLVWDQEQKKMLKRENAP
jgi:hypothetical protein